MREVMIGETADAYEKMNDLLCLLVTGAAERIYLPMGYNEPLEDLFPKGEKHTIFWFNEAEEELHVRDINMRSHNEIQTLLLGCLETFVGDNYEWDEDNWTAITVPGGRVLAYGVTAVGPVEDIFVEWVANLDNLFEVLTKVEDLGEE